MSAENELPEGWVQVTLEDITTPTRIIIQPSDRPELPFIGLEHVEAETMKLLGTGRAKDIKSHSLYFNLGNVLYGRLRPYLNKVFRPDFEGICSAEFIVFPKISDLESRYLQYFLNSWDFKEFASHLNAGDRPRVDWDQLKMFPFPLPPLLEQQRIVSIIEQQFSRLDAGVALLRQVHKKLKLYRASVLKAAVEGELTAQWRVAHPDIEPASELLKRILAERRAKWEEEQTAKGKDPKKVRYEEPVGPSESKLGELPKGWCYVYLQPLLSFVRRGITTGPFGSLLKKHEHTTNGIPVLGIENIEMMKFVYGSKINITKDKSKELSKYDALPGDILISRSGTVGEVCVVPNNLGEARIYTNLMRIVLAPNGMLPNHFCLLFNGSPTILNQIEELCKGSTRDFLNQKILSSIVFPLPPLAEQEQIVFLVEERMSIINELETTIEKALKQAERQRQSILHKAFTGKLVPQNPDDEPASVLLERIRQERQREQEEKLKAQKVQPKKGREKKAPKMAKGVQVPDGPVEPIDVAGLTQGNLWGQEMDLEREGHQTV